ncbi:Arc family DNA-binding protein [Methylorubrum zatmanii]|uniref:Arc family DNA-binding protein n=1 Tax=Methylorubrum zatmanii TaxID=29429 RepID=A0ABW1WM66_9HYPH|nr:Arc family DNA-binding protein [Methylorubrum zatmanii]MBD8906551.1 hypothetical protein [Methylorubrum zatmanii]
MSADTPAKDQDKFVLRLPDGMRDRLKVEAEANKRSMNAEIVARLDATLVTKTYHIASGERVLDMVNNIDPAALTKEEWNAQFSRFADTARNLAAVMEKIVEKVGLHPEEKDETKLETPKSD